MTDKLVLTCKNCEDTFEYAVKPGYTIPDYCSQTCYNWAYIDEHGSLYPELEGMHLLADDEEGEL